MSYGVRWFLGLLATLFVAGVLFLSLNKDSEETEPIPHMQASSAEKELVEVPVLLSEEKSLSDQTLKLTIDIHEPKVLLLNNPPYAKEANDVIRRFVDSIVDEFKHHASEARMEGGGDDDRNKGYTSDIVMRFTPLLLSPTIISIRFDVSEYYAPAPHPNNYARILNYHFKKRRILSATDLFASSTQALPFLSDYTRAALQKTFPDITESESALSLLPGTAPLPQNFEGVGITKNGLTVVFNPYQVAPYARGIPEVKIPLIDLGDTVSSEIGEAIRMANENIVEAQEMGR